MRFLVDESCDFAVARGLRSSGHDVVSVCEAFPGGPDHDVLRSAVEDERVLLTEDKDFGDWVFVRGEKKVSVVLLRFPAGAREMIVGDMDRLVKEHGSELLGSFTVLEPGRARIRKIRG